MLTGILIANTVFYGFYIDFITIPVLFQASNMGDMGSASKSCFTRFISLYFWILRFCFILVKGIKLVKEKRAPVPLKRMRGHQPASCCATLRCLRPSTEAVQAPFDREALVKGIGLFHFHLYDTISQTLNAGAKAFADEDSLAAGRELHSSRLQQAVRIKVRARKGAQCDFCYARINTAFCNG